MTDIDNNSPRVSPTVISSIVDLAEASFKDKGIRALTQEIMMHATRTSPIQVLTDFFKDLRELRKFLNDNGFDKRAQDISFLVKQLRVSVPGKE